MVKHRLFKHTENPAPSLFKPHPAFLHGSLQTIFGTIIEKKITPTHEIVHDVQLSDGDHVSVVENSCDSNRMVLLLHGLGSDARNIATTRMAAKFQQKGYHVLRMNHRGVGDGKGKSKGMYHAGRSLDILEVAQWAQKQFDKDFLLIGVSLSANISLRMVGMACAGESEPLPKRLKACIAINPILQAEKSVRAMKSVAYGVFDKYYVRRLKAQIEERHRLYPELGAAELPKKCTLYELDDNYTAKQNGFINAAHYYRETSPLQWLSHINFPTRIVTSLDDPIDVMNRSDFDTLGAGPGVNVELLKSGGHLGYFSKKKGSFSDNHWLDEKVIHEAEHCFKEVDHAFHETEAHLKAKAS